MGALLMLGSCDRRQRHWYSSSPKSLWSISLNISAIKLTWNQHTRAVSRDKAEYIMRERERITTHLTAVPRLRRLGLQQWGQRHDRQIESSGGVKNHRRTFWKWQITILDDRKETDKLGVFSGGIACIFPMHNIYKLCCQPVPAVFVVILPSLLLLAQDSTHLATTPQLSPFYLRKDISAPPSCAFRERKTLRDMCRLLVNI